MRTWDFPFPFWVIPTEADISLDVNGTDILYVQIAECNPKKRY